jgi:hypothetical protein
MKTRANKTQKFGPEELSERLDEQQEREFDTLVEEAAAGDERAVGAIAAALGPMLLEDARTVLEEFQEEADEVLRDFFQSLLDRRLRFDRDYGSALPWMCGVVQGIAHLRYRERERQEANAEDS